MKLFKEKEYIASENIMYKLSKRQSPNELINKIIKNSLNNKNHNR